VIIKTPSGKDITLNVSPSDTIRKIKQMIEEAEGIPRLKQSLVFEGEQLQEGSMLSDYEIGNKSIIDLDLLDNVRIVPIQPVLLK
jgi:hypothetical protein